MATAVVSGGAALLLQKNPALNRSLHRSIRGVYSGGIRAGCATKYSDSEV